MLTGSADMWGQSKQLSRLYLLGPRVQQRMSCSKQFAASRGKIPSKVASNAGRQHEDSREELQVMEQAHCMHRVGTWTYSRNTSSGLGINIDNEISASCFKCNLAQ